VTVAWVLLALILGAKVVTAQPPTRLIVDTWRVEDGLPQNTVTDIAQDARGYLWVATRKGLARFDGAQFRPIGRIGDVDLSNVRLTAVLPDGDDAIWVGTYGHGVMRLRDGHVETFGAAQGVPHQVIWGLVRDRTGRIWLSTSAGARVFDGTRWQPPPLPSDLASDGVNAVYQSRDGLLWLATSRHGLLRVDGTQVRQYSVEEGLPSALVTAVAETPDGIIWAATPHGVARIVGKTVTTLTVADGMPVERILQVMADRQGVLWMATHGGGLVRYDGGVFQILRRADGLSTDYLISLFEDREGALWVGTLSGGLNRLASGARALLDRRAGLPSFPITTVYQDHRGTYWIGTYGGGLVQIADGQVRRLSRAEGLPSDAITSIAAGPGTSLWVGTNGAGAFRLEGNRVIDHLEASVLGSPVRMIEFAGGDGPVWFAGNGLIRYERGVVSRVPTAGGLGNNEVRVLHLDRHGHLWVATHGGGLSRIDRHGAIRTWGTRDGLTNLFLTSMHHDDAGTIWIGSYGGGLFRLRGDRLTQVTTRDGLPEDVIFDVMQDDIGRLWLTGTGGMCVVKIADVHSRMDGAGPLLSVTRYGRADGVPGTDGTDGNQPLSLLARDGRLWFATVDGVVIFDPNEIVDSVERPSAFVDDLFVNKHAVPVAAAARPLTGRTLDVGFSAPQLKAGGLVQYQYRLIGLDDTWVDNGSRRIASFTNLAPGTYRFEVRAAARPGATAGPVQAIELSVPARFYETTWFAVATAVSVILLAIGLAQARFTRMQRRQQALEVVIAQRTAVLRHEMSERARIDAEGRALDERMQETQRLDSLGLLAGGVAHDFNNLLVGVLSEASLALGELPPGTPARQHVERIERAAVRASELTTQMLAYSGRGRFIIVPVALEDLVRELTDLLASVLNRGITVTLDFPPDSPLIAGDPTQVRQVVEVAVRSHGGRVTVRSTPVEGTSFTLWFPASAPVGAPTPEVRAIGDQSPVAEARPGAQVLVVDDERLVRDVASIALRRAGYAVRDVGSGEEALRLFEEAPRAYDAVVLDLTLPGIQGRGVLEAMRARRADIPILLTSGYTSHEAGDLTTAPATTFLQKPWRPDQLVATLEGLTGRAVRRDAGDTQPEAQAVARTGMLGSNGGRSS